MELFDFDVMHGLANLLALAVAFILALPAGWDRERSERRLGMRTLPLVAIASCGFALVGQSIAGDSSDAQARVLQGVITGVGFLGGGAIVKRGLDVHGTATAASIWVTAALGAAVAYGHYEIALTLSLITFLTLRWLKSIKHIIHEQQADASDTRPPQAR